MEKEIVEASATNVTELSGRKYKVRLIEGDRLGSTGYYPSDVLKEYGPKVFVKGTPMYLDHLSEAERAARPHGSVLNYAAELAEDAYYEGDGLYATVEVFEHHAPLIKSLKDKIGISIRARGHCVDQTINGKTVPVFQDFILARSADFVVKAGAGGKIVEMLEQANEQESDEDTKERELMEQEILEAVKAVKDAQESLTAKVDSLIAGQVEAEEAAKPSDEDILEIAEALAASSLSEVGRKRVLDLHRANGKPLAELIEAEEAYVTKAAVDAEESAGIEEEREAQESAKAEVKLPSRWAV